MQSPLQVLMIGCGNIAGGFDHDRPAASLPLTHAGAFTAHGGYQLVACIEPDAQRRGEFMQRWSVREGYAECAELATHVGRYDVISICSPTPLHAAHLAAAIELRPKLIFCEKPLTGSLRDSERSVAECKRAGVLLAVNYTRRWDPDVVRLAAAIKAGEWGAIRSVVAHYCKGVLNNGGHMIDLLQHLLGSLRFSCSLFERHDFASDDPSVQALLLTESGVPVYLNTGHAADYALFELQLIASSAVITMEDGGLNWRIRRAVPSENFRGYRTLDAGERRAGEYPRAMLNAVTNIHDAIRQDAPLASTGENALLVQRLCDRIRTATVHGEAPLSRTQQT